MTHILINCLLVALLFLVTIFFISCISSEVRAWRNEPPKKIEDSTFICRIYIGNIDYRCTTISDTVRDVFTLSPDHRVNYNTRKRRYEIDNLPYEVVINKDYLYIYKRELK